ncbi:hypothetical protein [Duncaniella muris]|uniref:hypothetical protein n=1 Tax=Duncaniella muris TaxID=2094150 RepID=UPI003F6619E7
MDRLDYFSAHPYHHCLCMLIEEAAGIELFAPCPGDRVLMDELSRIASHCLSSAPTAWTSARPPCSFYTLRVREADSRHHGEDLRRAHDFQL